MPPKESVQVHFVTENLTVTAAVSFFVDEFNDMNDTLVFTRVKNSDGEGIGGLNVGNFQVRLVYPNRVDGGQFVVSDPFRIGQCIEQTAQTLFHETPLFPGTYVLRFGIPKEYFSQNPLAKNTFEQDVLMLNVSVELGAYVGVGQTLMTLARPGFEPISQ